MCACCCAAYPAAPLEPAVAAAHAAQRLRGQRETGGPAPSRGPGGEWPSSPCHSPAYDIVGFTAEQLAAMLLDAWQVYVAGVAAYAGCVEWSCAGEAAKAISWQYTCEWLVLVLLLCC